MFYVIHAGDVDLAGREDNHVFIVIVNFHFEEQVYFLIMIK